GRDRHAALLRNWGDQQHVRAVEAGRRVEPLVRVFAKDRRRERAKALAEFDLQVQRRLHLRRARVAENAPRAQRPRPELHPALEPADDLALRQPAGDLREQLLLAGNLLVAGAEPVKRAANLGTREARAEE